MIIFDQLSLSYQDHSPVLDDLSFSIQKGECVLICGKSGSGKSSIARIINGLIPEYIDGQLNGKVTIQQLDLKHATLNDLVPLLGSVFQNPKNQHFALESNAELAIISENLGLPANQIQHRINTIIQQFNAESLLNRSIFKLSGGEKQQLAFLSAIIHDPDILILDEVTANLDQQAIKKIAQMIQILKDKGKTIILTEHRLAWSLDFVDRYLYLEDGHIAKEWSKNEMQDLNSNTLHHLGLRTQNLSKISEIVDSLPFPNVQSEAPLKIRDLVIGYDAPLTQAINSSFEAGNIIGILGNNGIGKTTFAHTLAGILKPLSGKILWHGKVMSPSELIKHCFIVLQDTNYQLFTESVEDEINFGLTEPSTNSEVILQNMDLFDKRHQHPMTLSGGEKQRLAIAAAIQSKKPIIIYDEPTSGLDYYHMIEFGKQMKQLANQNMIQLIITHDEELVANFCDQIIDFNRLTY